MNQKNIYFTTIILLYHFSDTIRKRHTQTRACLYLSTTRVLELIGVSIFSAIRPFFQESHRVFVVRARNKSILFSARSATKGFIRFLRLRITVPTKIMNTYEIVTFRFFQSNLLKRIGGILTFRVLKKMFFMQIAGNVECYVSDGVCLCFV